jgi:hypothetical protein
LAFERILAVPPVLTVLGSDAHAISGERSCFTLNLALQEATPFLLPSLKFAFTWYEPGRNPVVSIRVEEFVPATLNPVPLQLYRTACLELKFDPMAVPVTGSPAKTSTGSAEQAADADAGCSPLEPK